MEVVDLVLAPYNFKYINGKKSKLITVYLSPQIPKYVDPSTNY